MEGAFTPEKSNTNSHSFRLEQTLGACGTGNWEFDIRSGTFHFSDVAKSLLGFSANNTITFPGIHSLLSENDKVIFENTWKILLENPTEDFISLVVHPLNNPGSVLFRAKKFFDQQGSAEFITGTLTPVGSNESLPLTETKPTQPVEQEPDLSALPFAPTKDNFRYLLEQLPVGICLFVGKDMVVELANELMIKYWGKDSSVNGKPLSVAFPELVGQPFLDILANIVETGETFNAINAPVDIIVDGVMGTYYYNYTYKPLFDEQGKVYAIIDMSLDVTEQVLAEKALRESEAKLSSVVASAPSAIGLFVGKDLVLETHNQALINLIGNDSNLSGQPLRDLMPQFANADFDGIVDQVYTSGTIYQSTSLPVEVVKNGIISQRFYNFTFSPILGNEENIYAILGVATDVTATIETQKKIEESQLQLLSLFEQSPIAIAMISKDDLVFTMANPFYVNLVGKTQEQLIGNSLLKAIPELEGQGFEILLRNVIDTEIPFISKEQAVEIRQNDVLTTIYVDLTYQPQHDLEGKVSGILVVATDITEQVVARQKIEQAEASLRGAVELANLGTWYADITTGRVEFSQRLRQWFGLMPDEKITVQKNIEAVIEKDRARVDAALVNATAPGSDGIYDIEYTIQTSGKLRIIHAQGTTVFDREGNALSISGTVQDVTLQRETELALELQVQERTEELEATNEEMAAINEEYLAINEELGESNNLLLQSNENLQRFAYVASHDLQEPLRKIQSFGNLLTLRFSGELGEGKAYLQRMQAAAKRMSDLIEDLLLFSRITDRSFRNEKVDLNEVIEGVLSDLELSIQESSATISVEKLPEIIGDQPQLSQLFQNLVSNALKFRKEEVPAHIQINCKTLRGTDIPVLSAITRTSKIYYKIDVIDNGIGFDQQYADRIFQLFQRLHGKSEYKGTGIGLAICEKVVANHGGAISVKSEVGEGSVFSVFLPVTSDQAKP